MRSNHEDDDDTVVFESRQESSLTELRARAFYADAAPADPNVLNEDADGDRTLDELF